MGFFVLKVTFKSTLCIWHTETSSKVRDNPLEILESSPLDKNIYKVTIKTVRCWGEHELRGEEKRKYQLQINFEAIGCPENRGNVYL